MRISVLLLIGVILVVSTFEADVARAQPQSPPAEAEPETTAEAPAARPGIEEFVVLAGESEAVSDYAAGDSVTGFNASDLEALGAQSVADLADFTPNLAIVTAGSTTPTFFIRGVGLNDFNANSSGAVAIYQDDVPINSSAMQLGTLFDVEAVNILKGPQGTGPARNASAGAIKVYSRKPSGGYGAYLRQEYGNFNSLDFEGAVEAPIYEDVLLSRFAFRVSERDGYSSNGCGGAPPNSGRTARPPLTRDAYLGDDLWAAAEITAPLNPAWSICGERVDTMKTVVDPTYPIGDPRRNQLTSNPEQQGFSVIPAGLPETINNLGNWAARGMLMFRPTLDSEWLLTAHGSRRDEQARLGQSYGTNGVFFLEDGSRAQGVLGGTDSGGYRPQEVRDALNEANACRQPGVTCNAAEAKQATNDAQAVVARELARNLDSRPQHGDYNHVGPTENDVWGVALKGEIVLGNSFTVRSISGYDTYDRLIDIDLDFSPNVLFESRTKDDGWQFTQGLELSGHVSEDLPLRFDVGGFYLMEQLNVVVVNNTNPNLSIPGNDRDYTQKLWSAAAYGSFAWDFWDDFTLDGGVRYNWEKKEIDFLLKRQSAQFPDFKDKIWSAPTGTIRLTYRFREDMHAYWKYTRGWKGGHFNATSGDAGVTVADPETIDSFEAGLRGSWLEGRLNLDFSIFHYNYDDYQIFTSEQQLGGQPEFVVLNANDAEIYGSEVELAARPLPGSFLTVRFAWLETQFLDFVQVQPKVSQGTRPIVLEAQANNTGNSLLNSPQFKVSITAEQTLALGRWGSLTPRYDAAWTADTNYDATEAQGFPNTDGVQFLPENTIGQRAFWQHNLRLGYKTPDGSIELAGWVRNLTDENPKAFAFDASTFQQTTIYFIGEPRTYGLSLLTTF